MEFRAWDKQKKQYRYFGISELMRQNQIDYAYSDDELERWTGLVDRNGRKIYENDIVRTPQFKRDGKPNGSRGNKVVQFIRDHRFKNGWNVACGDRVEVIGNLMEEKVNGKQNSVRMLRPANTR